MAIRNYAVLKGSPVVARIFPPMRPHDQPHYHIHVKAADGGDYDIAVNIESGDGSEVLYYVAESFSPPNASLLQALSTPVSFPDHAAGGLAIDFVRIPGLVNRDEMTLLPIDKTDPTSVLHNKLDELIQKAIAQQATLYAFGQAFHNGPNTSNPFFKFHPDQGIHDIHMNQGNPPGRFAKDNGIFQDGALFVEFPDGSWSAVFIAFQSESFKTDENGNQIS